MGYRYFAERAAQGLGLRGWVRNLWSGDVETEVEGPREALVQYLGQLRRGPGYSRVVQIEETWEEDEGRHQDFRIRPTG